MNIASIAAYSNTVEQVRSIDSAVILARSTDSAAMLEYWDMTDCIVEGANAIKLAGEKYLPKFPKEKLPNGNIAYEFRLSISKFTNIYRDIIESLAAKPFEEEISLVEGEGSEKKPIPQSITDLLEDIDGAGTNLTGFASLTFFNGINSAIDWIFVDFPKSDPSIRTQADARAARVRPFWSHVLGRNVLEARVAVIGGKETLVYMRIFEPGKLDRVRIFERTDTGAVVWSLWVKDTAVGETNGSRNGSKFILEDQGNISIGVIPLVPFTTGRRDGRSFKYYPAMRDAADLQIELYQAESGLKFAKVMTAYAMLAANGIKPQMGPDGKTPLPVDIGPAVVLYGSRASDGSPGSWSFIEPSATSLRFLADDIKETKQDLRELGRLPLTAQSGNLTTITTAVAAGKAKSAVGAWALILKNTLENALVLTCMWQNIKENEYSPEISVYTDFDNFMEGGADLEHLRSMRSTGDLSRETLWIETKRRRILSSEFDKDVEIARLLEEVPGEDDIDDEPLPVNPPLNQPPIIKEPT